MDYSILLCVLWIIIHDVSGRTGRSCSDKYPSKICAAFKAQGDCWKVQSACKRTCGYCRGRNDAQLSKLKSSPNCRDASAQCTTLALTGFCTTYPNVRISCPASCGTCQTVSEHPKRGTWDSWGPYGRCSATCDSGTWTRYRKCIGKGCGEPSFETAKCLLKPCPTVRPCTDISAICKAGIMLSSHTCSNPRLAAYCRKSCGKCSEDSPPAPPPPPPPPKCEEWSAYGPCSVTCGRGRMTRRRACPNGSSEVTVSISTCNIGICPLPSKEPPTTATVPPQCGAWSSFSRCSVACGIGRKRRSRTCPAGSKEKTTSSKRCRIRRCILRKKANVDAPPSTPQPTTTTPPVTCEDWSAYGPCSVTCGTGKKTRTRVCPKASDENTSSSVACMNQDCPAPSTTSPPKTTSSPKCGEWTAYGRCSVTCGTGKKTKTRVCPKERKEDSTSTTSCKLKSCHSQKSGPGRWTGWGRYGTCSVTCGGGTQTRKRRCVGGTVCNGPDEIERKCNTQPCRGTWTGWAPAGKCTASCDGGTRKFTRRCKNGVCPGPSEKTIKCNMRKCIGTWGPWVGVSECTKTCGGGMQVLKRQCSNNNCRGSAQRKARCNTKRCPVTMSSWSECTKSCGSGTQYRKKSNGIKEFRTCSNQRCKTAMCPRHETRYGITHECCKVSAAAPGQMTCGKQPAVERVIGGVNAKERQWPWMARIDMDSGGICSGVLISARYMVSAAHCFVHQRGYRLDTKDWKVHFGIVKHSKVDSENSVSTGIRKVTVHPEFKFPKADIAVVELNSSLEFSPYIQPICLPGGEITPFDTKCYVTGWGVSDTPNKATNTLQEVAVQNLKLDVCRSSYKVHHKDYSDFVSGEDRILCAGSLDKSADSCVGDSGGPLACQRCSSCTWYLAGVVSFGKNDPCGMKGVPGIYTRVLDYEKWIHGITKIKRTPHLCLRRYGP